MRLAVCRTGTKTWLKFQSEKCSALSARHQQGTELESKCHINFECLKPSSGASKTCLIDVQPLS